MFGLIKEFLKNEDGGFLSFLAPIAGALISSSSSNRAAKSQAQAARDAAEVQQNIFDTTSEYFAPYRQAGEGALQTYQDQVGTEFTQSPGYDFRLQQGIDAIDASAASRGNLFSGATLQGVNQFGQDYATNAYENWLSRVGSLVNTGQASAGSQAALGQNFANNQSNLLTQAGNARAAGQVGVGNAINSGINDALGIWQYQQGQQ